MDWQEQFNKKLDNIDSKLDTLIKDHQGIYKDVEWLKGSLKISVTLLIPAILAGIGFLVKMTMVNP